jgi:hypothetical protein
MLPLALLATLAVAEPAYPLDGIERAIPARGRLVCPTVNTVSYAGTRFAYASRVRVYRAFAEKLRAFEDVVVEVARRHFGRGPTSMRHAGTYSCRRIAAYPTLLSEHGLANAIDVVGFEFPAAPRSARGVPAGLGRAFSVSLADWQNPASSARARFLDELAHRLVDRRDVFRVLLGPGYPGHHGHFHFDMAPFRLVAIWSALDASEPDLEISPAAP